MSESRHVRVVGRKTVHKADAVGEPACGTRHMASLVETDAPPDCPRPGCDPNATATLAAVGRKNLIPGGGRSK